MSGSFLVANQKFEKLHVEIMGSKRFLSSHISLLLANTQTTLSSPMNVSIVQSSRVHSIHHEKRVRSICNMYFPHGAGRLAMTDIGQTM
jgi:hypothetical protein